MCDPHAVEGGNGAEDRRSPRRDRSRRCRAVKEGRLLKNGTRILRGETRKQGKIVMEGSRTSSFWRDLRHILERFEEVHGEDAGLRFVEALEETIDLIERFPDLGSPWESARPRRSGLRFQTVKGFEKYVVSTAVAM